MAVNADKIASFLRQYGWTFEQLDDVHFVTGFDSDVTDAFSIYITMAPNWVYFAIAPFVPAPTDNECQRKLYHHLLWLCQEMNLAKFSVDSDGDVVLTVELPRNSLDYAEFADALDALSYYADQNYVMVHTLATDPSALSGFAAEQELEWKD